eukprot:IDg1164t1
MSNYAIAHGRTAAVRGRGGHLGAARSKCRSNRAGIPNYSTDEICALLDLVAEHEPLSANDWALVRADFSVWGKAQIAELNVMKTRYEKNLTNSQTLTKESDSSCPADVRRAKHIANNILSRASAICIEQFVSTKFVFIDQYSRVV